MSKPIVAVVGRPNVGKSTLFNKLTSCTLGVPAVMLREEKDTFLDDVTITQLGERLGVKVEVLPVGGGDEARALLRSGLHIARRKR